MFKDPYLQKELRKCKHQIWNSIGATFAGAPAALTANTPIALIYDNATTNWYITN